MRWEAWAKKVIKTNVYLKPHRKVDRETQTVCVCLCDESRAEAKSKNGMEAKEEEAKYYDSA